MIAPRLRPIEGVIALEAIALLACLAMPSIREASMRRRVELATRDIGLVTNAALAVHARSGTWPEDAPSGHAPKSMARALPAGFTFEREGYALDWDRWPLSDESRPGSSPSEFAGLSLTSHDSKFRARVVQAVGDRIASFTVGSRITWSLSDGVHPTR